MNSVFDQNIFDTFLVCWVDVLQDDVLIRRYHHRQVVKSNNLPQRFLQLEISLVLNPSVLNEKTEEIIAVTLVVPAQPTLVLPFW